MDEESKVPSEENPAIHKVPFSGSPGDPNIALHALTAAKVSDFIICASF